jgi:hypothetical protein
LAIYVLRRGTDFEVAELPEPIEARPPPEIALMA